MEIEPPSLVVESGGRIKVSLDRIDITILKELKRNCRISFEELARNLGVTSTTIKKRVRDLKSSRTLRKYVVELEWSVYRAERVLLLITTEKSEDRNDFVNRLGQNLTIENASSLSDGRYLVLAVCNGIEELTELDRFIRALSPVQLINVHPLITRQIENVPITKMQYDILRCLVEDPRLDCTSIASQINRSAKGVRRGIKRLIDSGIVHFTLQSCFFMFFVEIKYLLSSHYDEISQWINNEFSCVWEILASSLEPILFVIFATDKMDETSYIMNKLRENPFLKPHGAAVCDPMIFFESSRHNRLKQLNLKMSGTT